LKLVLEEARKEQIKEIRDLVNLAYRGESGWTKETDLVGGDRSSSDEVKQYMSDPNAHLLVAMESGEIRACICIEEDEGCVYIGFFAVHPSMQGRKWGWKRNIVSSRKLRIYETRC